MRARPRIGDIPVNRDRGHRGRSPCAVGLGSGDALGFGSVRRGICWHSRLHPPGGKDEGGSATVHWPLLRDNIFELDAGDAPERIRNLVAEPGGRVVKSTGDGLLALFPMPSSGVECATGMRSTRRAAGVDIRAGLHVGEVELHDDGDISGIAVNLTARVEQAAEDECVWVSSTVRDMMMGTDVVFHPEG